MRQIYSSPRPENIDRLVALMAEHGIETTIRNRSNYNHPGHRRFSYLEPDTARTNWEQLWVTHADDYTKAREVMRDLGLEPSVRFEADLAAWRNRTPAEKRKRTVAWTRHLVLLAVLIVATFVALRNLGWI